MKGSAGRAGPPADRRVDASSPAVPAATLVPMRDGEHGPEVLLLRRSLTSGFVPGAYVFPGGRVEAADASPAALAKLDALTPARAAERLGLTHGDPPAIAYYVAALREAFEETGLLVAVTRDGRPAPTAAGDEETSRVRDELMEGGLDFGGALECLGCRIAGDSIEYLAHWITPEAEPRRYDTRFFAAAVLGGAEPSLDAREMTHALWIRPSLAIRRADRGELRMILPTVRTLEQLAGFPDTADALRYLSRRSPPTIMPTLRITPSGARSRSEDHG